MDDTYIMFWGLLIGIIILIILIRLLIRYLMKKRIAYALKLGKIEHNSGRLLGLLLFATLLLEYFKLGITIYMLIVCCIMWSIYLLSHTFEKKLYPRNFRF